MAINGTVIFHLEYLNTMLPRAYTFFGWLCDQLCNRFHHIHWFIMGVGFIENLVRILNSAVYAAFHCIQGHCKWRPLHSHRLKHWRLIQLN
jgi:hypothetical protein